MTQFQHTLKALLEGRKTETSRIVKANQLWYPNLGVIADSEDHGWNNRTVWAIGKDYAIQPGRTIKSIGRYRVEAIWRQDVRTLTAEQISAEGFYAAWGSRWDFMQVWIQMHDTGYYNLLRKHAMLPGEANHPSSEAYWGTRLNERLAERYQAWRMTIQVLWDTVDWDAPAVKALQIEPKVLN
jgi:hypothetical protein